jgi:hypothetical protein
MDKCDPETLEGLIERLKGIPLTAIDRETFPPLLDAMERELWLETASRN